MSALSAILRPHAAGDAAPTASPAAPSPATTPAPDPVQNAVAALNADVRVWRGISLALSVVSVWLGVKAIRENSRYRKALADAAKSRDARRAALKTLSE